MLLTEARAANLACPLMTGVWGGNRPCTASACPMWRWATPEQVDFSAFVQELGKIRVEQSGEPDPPATPRRGYCGLAGKPEYP